MTIEELALEIRRQRLLGHTSTESLAEGLLPLFDRMQTETLVEETGDVERVARAIYEAERGGTDSRWIKTDAFSKGIYLGLARAALAAMRPAVDPVKLAEIRARHDSVADMADDEWDNRIYTIADDAFSDRAFLLSVIEGVNHDD